MSVLLSDEERAFVQAALGKLSTVDPAGALGIGRILDRLNGAVSTELQKFSDLIADYVAVVPAGTNPNDPTEIRVRDLEATIANFVRRRAKERIDALRKGA